MTPANLRKQLLIWRYLTLALIMATVGALVWHGSLALWICLMVQLGCLSGNVLASRRLPALPAAPKSPFEILGVPPGASDEMIDVAFGLKAMAAHPDRGGSASAMAELNEARRKLKGQAA